MQTSKNTCNDGGYVTDEIEYIRCFKCSEVESFSPDNWRLDFTTNNLDDWKNKSVLEIALKPLKCSCEDRTYVYIKANSYDQICFFINTLFSKFNFTTNETQILERVLVNHKFFADRDEFYCFLNSDSEYRKFEYIITARHPRHGLNKNIYFNEIQKSIAKSQPISKNSIENPQTPLEGEEEMVPTSNVAGAAFSVINHIVSERAQAEAEEYVNAVLKIIDAMNDGDVIRVGYTQTVISRIDKHTFNTPEGQRTLKGVIELFVNHSIDTEEIRVIDKGQAE